MAIKYKAQKIEAVVRMLWKQNSLANRRFMNATIKEER